jgi:hypothetical protein
VFSFPFIPKKKLVFASSFCKIELNTMQKFDKKVVILHFGFWSQETKKIQKSLKRSS